MQRLLPPASRILALSLLILMGVLVACAPDEPAADQPAAAIPAAETDFAAGRNVDGTFYRGEADAPVTLIDYSDFL